MKIANAFSLLSAVLIFACYVDVYETGKSSDSYYSSSTTSSSSSSSQEIAFQDTIIISGQSYKTIKMGSTIWFAENLNAEPKSGKGNWWCHGNLSERCSQYGKLYDWEAAMNVCPDGWRLPNKEDFKNLSNFDKDILSSEAWWNAAFGGFKYEDDGDFSSPVGRVSGGEAYWWSSTESGKLANYSSIRFGDKLYYDSYMTKARAYSVRCVKNG